MEFSELKSIIELKKVKDDLVRSDYLGFVRTKKTEYPLIGFSIGSQDPNAPTFGIFGGVHGLERVGTHVVVAFLSNVVSRLSWDEEFRKSFENFRLVSIPLINPGGMAHYHRANPNGVDLMRNAPVEIDKGDKPVFLLSGHRYGPGLPWFRGQPEIEMEVESKTVVDFVKEEMLNAPVSVSLDIHSGFGMKDRLWYPYAKSTSPFPYKDKIFRIKELLDVTLPHHIYTVEPQSHAYITHGDLWDYLFEISRKDFNENIYIPWTLELGSWMWVKKNPTQIFSALGLFNPMKRHRYNRTMRRHLLLIDFLCQIVKNPKSWTKVQQ